MEDGTKNAFVHVQGGEPNPAASGSNSTALPPNSTRNGAGDLVFTFRRKTASVGGVNLALQWASDHTFPPLNSVPIGARSSTFDGITAVEDAIRSIEAATTQPELRSIMR